MIPFLALLLPACIWVTGREFDEHVAGLQHADVDGDGYSNAEDCDDGEDAVYPDAPEVCDSQDNDCDGRVDEDPVGTPTWRDADQDGYGVTADRADTCIPPSGYVTSSGDCDDTRSDLHPGAVETCDGEDDDCDGVVDDGSPPDEVSLYADADGDGFGDPTAPLSTCQDTAEGYVEDQGDCDDGDPTVNPAAAEACDGADDDCDGDTDEATAVDAPSWYRDADADGFGDAGEMERACVEPEGFVGDDTDCDDTAATALPGGTEVCDHLDNDCDGATDEAGALDAPAWYADADGDGFGDLSVTRTACDAPAGYLSNGDDCDDARADRSPATAETCDGEDDDCDGIIDDGAPPATLTWFADADGDGYGDAAAPLTTCETGLPGYVADASDCDDADAAVSPAATEVCNDFSDNNCNGTPDGCVYSGDFDLSGAMATVTGEAALDYAGASIDIAGDLDGDGQDDLVVGGLGGSTNNGMVWVWYGPVSGSLPVGTADATVSGVDVDALTYGVVVGGDVDGDGYDDLFIGGQGESTYGDENGAIYLVYGPTSGDVALEAADTWLTGVTADANVGKELYIGADYDGDGEGEVLWSGPTLGVATITTTMGRVSGDATLILTPDGNDTPSLRPLGDTDGDGLADLVVGDAAIEGGGGAYVVRGALTGTVALPDLDCYLTADADGTGAGRRVAGIDDVTGDGLADILVTGATEKNRVYVITGTASGEVPLADVAFAAYTGSTDDFGLGLADGGDLDQDGQPDLVLSNALNEVFLYFAPQAGIWTDADADARLYAGDSALLGDALAAKGDIDGDGRDDLAIGDRAWPAGAYEGAVYILPGSGY